MSGPDKAPPRHVVVTAGDRPPVSNGGRGHLELYVRGQVTPLGQWCIAYPRAVPCLRKTDIYDVRSVAGEAWLGTIQWYAAWRKYSFHPRPETVFEADCLRAIADFLASLTKDHRSATRSRRP